MKKELKASSVFRKTENSKIAKSRLLLIIFITGIILILSVSLVSASLLGDMGNWFSKLFGNKDGNNLKGELGTASPLSTEKKLIAYYPLDGNANDASGNGNNGVNNGAIFVAGKIGQAASFNGINNHISIANPSSLNNLQGLTVSVWIKPSSSHVAWERIIDKGYDSAFAFNSWDVNNNFNFNIANSPFVSTTKPLDNNWHHILATVDGTNLKIYVDGVLDNTVSQTSSIGSNNYPLTIGADMSTYPNHEWFNGSIDEVKIWNYALSPSEINTEYQRGNVCVPQCSGKQCGDDGCWGSCGSCVSGQTCSNGVCVALTDPCSSKNCDDRNLCTTDSCSNGNCINTPKTCLSGQSCSNGQCVAVEKKLIASYPFEGNANDVSGSGNNGVNNGASFVSGKIGQAASFNGINNYISIPDSSSLQSMSNGLTMGLWIKSNNNSNVPISRWSNPLAGGYGLYTDGSWYMGDGSNTGWKNIASGRLADNQWHYYTFVWNATNMISYRDGSIVATSGVFTNPYFLTAAYDRMLIGADNRDGLLSFNGLIDEVKIWNYVLNQAEINQEYQRGNICIPNCASKQCGDNGCGGNCGSCSTGQTCSNGVCVALTDPCANKNCNDNNACTDDSCSNGNCINTPKTCLSGQICSNGNCITTSCNPTWQCSGWSSCSNSQQTRICTDSNNCRVLSGKPAETQACSESKCNIVQKVLSFIGLADCSVETKPPVAFYSFEGNANDVSGNGNNGVLLTTYGNNGVTFVAGKTGQGASFNGKNNYISIPDSDKLKFSKEYTLSAWIYRNVYCDLSNECDNYAIIISKYNNLGNYNYVMELSNEKFPKLITTFEKADGTGYVILKGITSIPLNKWVYVVAVKTPTELRLYVNGKLDKAGIDYGTMGDVITSSGSLNIGRLGGILGFKGTIDEVKIWDYALSDSEIRGEYEKECVGECINASSQILNCTPNCTGKVCGSDGCDGFCGPLNGDCDMTGVSGLICSNGKCISKNCSFDSDCGTGRLICSNGKCIVGGCSFDSDCGMTGLICSNGKCIAGGCIPIWRCGSWGKCNNGQQTRICKDMTGGINSRRGGENKNCNDTTVYKTRSCGKNSNLIAYYHFKEGLTNVVDYSGNGNNGVVKGYYSVVDPSDKFSIVTNYEDKNMKSYAEIPNSASLENINEGTYTWSVWYYPMPDNSLKKIPGYDAHNIICRQGYHTSLYYGSDEKFYFSIWNNLKQQTIVGEGNSLIFYYFPLYRIYYIVGVVNSSSKTVSIYVNGRLIDSKTYQGDLYDHGKNPIKIGTCNNPGQDYDGLSYGQIWNVEIWNRALSLSEIQDEYEIYNLYDMDILLEDPDWPTNKFT